MEREWATDPFEVAAVDGYLYGRGTSDNKVGGQSCCAFQSGLHSNFMLG